VVFVKRLVGRSFTDGNFQRYIKSLHFSVEENNLVPCVNNRNDDVIRKITIESILTRIFNKIKIICTEKLNVDSINAVVSVPSYFNPVQRKSIKNAINKSGLRILRFISETIAISIAYSRKYNILKNKQIMIVDFGAGKLEASIVEISDPKNFVQLIVKGDNDFGGLDLNDKVIEHYIKLLKRKSVDIRNNKRAVQKLGMEIEKAKRRLSSDSEVKIEINNLVENYNFSQILSVDDFETLNEQLFQRFSELIASFLKEALITEIDISEVILAGGSTRIPQIKRILDKLMISTFGHTVPIIQMNEYTEEAHVAFGASFLSSNKIHVLNLIPFSLGFSQNDGGFKKLIEKNSYLPVKFSESYTTKNCNSVSIYLGDSLIANENDYLLKFNTNIVKEQKSCTILITIDLDINGILEISFIDKTMEKKKTNETNKNVHRSNVFNHV
jgi:molecular chaperone DnaK (HSP70)